jgi:prepilin-type N-terminal cleavage/methylation domain-containing protein
MFVLRFRHSRECGNPGPIPSASISGFTLIELLVVVAIILVLISIALPNFLEAVTRSNITASRGDMRSLGIALEMYNVDHKEYPQAIMVRRELNRLVSPVQYIEDLPDDRFDSSDGGRRRTYQYGAMDLDHATRWILAGRGPDRDSSTGRFDLEAYPGYHPLLFIGLYFNPAAETPEYFDYMSYSPTNGTISVGDLYQASDYNNS